MWAYRLTQPGRFELIDTADPRPEDLAPGQVLLRTVTAGLCGSDLPVFRGTPLPHRGAVTGGALAAPGFPMHEIVGDVLASTDSTLRAGERVVGWADRADAMAEYVVTAATSVHPVGDRWSADVAVLLQPLACVLHAVSRLGDIRGTRVAVLGQGPIGVLFSHVLKAGGAGHVIGVDEVDRADVAGVFGVDEMVTASTSKWVAGLDHADRPGLVVEAIGHQQDVLRDAILAADDGGLIYAFGIPDNDCYPFNIDTFLRKDLTLMAGVTRQRRRALAAAAEYLADHPEIAGNVTSRYPMTNVEDAFRAAIRPRPGQLKIVVEVG